MRKEIKIKKKKPSNPLNLEIFYVQSARIKKKTRNLFSIKVARIKKVSSIKTKNIVVTHHFENQRETDFYRVQELVTGVK